MDLKTLYVRLLAQIARLKEENGQLKDLVAELSIQVRVLKKNLLGLE